MTETPEPAAVCVCGEPNSPGVAHRMDGPCYVPDRRMVAPATDRTALRERIAEALRHWVHPTDRGTAADAVLAALPAADRAAVLRWAADELDALDPVEAALAGQHAWSDAAQLLRRLAAESAAAGPDQTHTPCGPAPSQCDAEAGEPCTDHERQQAHAEGEHCVCGPECAAPAVGGAQQQTEARP